MKYKQRRYKYINKDVTKYDDTKYKPKKTDLI